MLKQYLSLTVFLGILVLLVGCDNFENPVTGPELTAIEESQTQELNFVGLPQGDGLFKSTVTSATITPQTGGTLDLNYSSGQGKERVQVRATLQFTPGSVSEDVDVSMELLTDSGVLMFDFNESGTEFLKPGKFSVDARGLDLAEADGKSEVKLVYFADNGWEEEEEIEPLMIRYNDKNDQLQCVNAPIRHFSRYAFAF